MADEQQTELIETDAESIEANLDEVMAALDTPPATERSRDEQGRFSAQHESEAETDEVEAEDAAPQEETSGEVEEEEGEPETTIDPPIFWSADEREAWNSLTPAARQIVLDKETERNAVVTRMRNEAAEARKSAETAAEAARQERQRYADVLNNGSLLAALDPVLAEGSQTDWALLARMEQEGQVDQGTYNAKLAAYQQRLSLHNAMAQERNRVMEQHADEARQARKKALSEAYPDFGNEATAAPIWQAFEPVMADAGFTRAEIDAFRSDVPDPRYIQILKDAAEMRKIRAARKTVGQKKAVPAAVRVQKPRASDNAKQGPSNRVKALDERAKRTGILGHQADAILAHLMEGT